MYRICQERNSKFGLLCQTEIDTSLKHIFKKSPVFLLILLIPDFIHKKHITMLPQLAISFLFPKEEQCQQSAMIPHALPLKFNDRKALARCTKRHLLEQSYISLSQHLAAKVLTHILADSPCRARAATVRFANQLFTSCSRERIQNQPNYIQCCKTKRFA